jgi:hypothetical protein
MCLLLQPSRLFLHYTSLSLTMSQEIPFNSGPAGVLHGISIGLTSFGLLAYVQCLICQRLLASRYIVIGP